MDYDEGGNLLRLAALSDRGVRVWGGGRVYVDRDVRLENIESGAEIRNATICGAETYIGAEAKIGVSGLAVLTNTQIGRRTEIGAGTFDTATILDDVRIRGFAELRPGTLIEEACEAAHNVAFKNSILTATCVVGSLVNFCDVYLSGGTGRDDHSEVGSGAVHFNFDPRGDKWSSVMGDARGVLLQSAPIFVGGQVGVIGPVHVGFGAVLAAGSVVRRDVDGDCVSFSPPASESKTLRGFDRRKYGSVRHKLATTTRLISTLHALERWYRDVRLTIEDPFEKALCLAGLGQIERHRMERVGRLDKLIGKLTRSQGSDATAPCAGEHQRLSVLRQGLLDALRTSPESPPPMGAIAAYGAARAGRGHVEALQVIDPQSLNELSDWLSACEREVETRVSDLDL